MGQMINAIAEFFGMILSNIYMVVPNFGLAIIIMTLLVKLVTFPLNNKQIQSARRMQELQPEIKKIQNKYKNDKEKQNKAVMEFMQQNKVNPLAGCLPLLVQFPILIAIFQLLREAEKFGITELPGFSPYLIPAFNFIDLMISPTEAGAFAYWLFPIIAGATTFVQSKQTMSDPNQKMLLYMMPAMITFFSFSFPVGLVIYWIMNNVFTMGQHYFMGRIDKFKAEQKDNSEKKQEKGEKKDSEDN